MANFAGLVDIAIDDLKDGVLRALGENVNTSNLSKSESKNYHKFNIDSFMASAVKALIEDCTTLEFNCGEYKKLSEEISREYRLLKEKLKMSEKVSEQSDLLRKNLSKVLLKNKELTEEISRLRTERAEMIAVMKEALSSPDEELKIIKDLKIENYSLREEISTLQKLLKIGNEKLLNDSISNDLWISNSLRPPTIISPSHLSSPHLITSPRSSPRISPKMSPRSEEVARSEAMEPAEELADVGMVILSPRGSPNSVVLGSPINYDLDDNDLEGVEKELHDTATIPTVSSPTLAGMTPPRRI